MELNNIIFIPGAGRAGTTFIMDTLSSHPDISACMHKEPCYFDRNNHLGEEWYKALFNPKKGEKFFVEASTNYFWYPNSLELIKEKVSNPKFVISLRDPSKRAIAEYRRRIEKSGETRSLEYILKNTGYGSKRSKYSENLNRVHNLFGSKSYKVLIFEEWISDYEYLKNELAEFLGLENVFECPKVKRILLLPLYHIIYKKLDKNISFLIKVRASQYFIRELL